MNCNWSEFLSKLIAMNTEAAATINVAMKADLFINSLFLVGISAIKPALINGRIPIIVNRLMQSLSKQR